MCCFLCGGSVNYFQIANAKVREYGGSMQCEVHEEVN